MAISVNDGYKKIKGTKLSVLVDKNGLPLSVYIAPANAHDSNIYLPTVTDFKIKIPVGRSVTRPELIIGDASYDTKKIRSYNAKRGINPLFQLTQEPEKQKEG